MDITVNCKIRFTILLIAKYNDKKKVQRSNLTNLPRKTGIKLRLRISLGFLKGPQIHTK